MSAKCNHMAAVKTSGERAMLIYIARRIVLTLPTLLMVSVIVFTLMHLIPVDPAQVLRGEDADKATIAAMHRELGLDRPLPEQYLKWLGHAAHGDMGESIVTHEPVRTMIADRFQLSATIALISVGLATLIATVIGMVAAWKRDSTLDLAIVSGASIVLAVPSFWLGMVLLLVFGLHFGWLPVVGYVPFAEGAWQWALFLVLPVVTLTTGLSVWSFFTDLVFPPAFAPTLPIVPTIMGPLLGGIAVLDTVFTLLGL